MSTRIYPTNNCEFYTENVVSFPNKASPHRLRRNQLKNPVRVFRAIENPNCQSYICSWGNGQIFNRNTNLNIDQLHCRIGRIRQNFNYPTAGRRGLWKFNRVGPCKMFQMPLSHWNIQPFIDDFRRKLSNSRATSENESQVQDDNQRVARSSRLWKMMKWFRNKTQNCRMEKVKWKYW